jgi:hypothetical protein
MVRLFTCRSGNGVDLAPSGSRVTRAVGRPSLTTSPRRLPYKPGAYFEVTREQTLGVDALRGYSRCPNHSRVDGPKPRLSRCNFNPRGIAEMVVSDVVAADQQQIAETQSVDGCGDLANMRGIKSSQLASRALQRLRGRSESTIEGKRSLRRRVDSDDNARRSCPSLRVRLFALSCPRNVGAGKMGSGSGSGSG